MTGPRGGLRLALGLAALLALTVGLLEVAGLVSRPVTLDVGPSTGAYLHGFTPSEERPPLTFRWARKSARLDVPLVIEGPAVLRLRCARFLDDPATVRVTASGSPVGSFVARPGGFKIHAMAVELHGPLRFGFETESASAEDLGVALDWVRLEGARTRLPRGFLWPHVLVLGVFGLSLTWGARPFGAWLWSSLAAGSVAGLAAWDPVAVVHLAPRIAVPGLTAAALITLALKRERRVVRSSGVNPSSLVVDGPLRGRVVAAVFLVAYLVKGVGLFHPSAFYADVRTWARLSQGFAAAQGGLVERGLETQVRNHHVRFFQGHAYTPPYSPVFLVPFAWLPQEREVLEDAFKHVALLAAALEVVAVFALGALVLGDRVGFLAALLSAFLPPLFSRLLLAMYPTIVGHLLDMAVVGCAVLVALRPEDRRRTFSLALVTLVALLTYVSSLFTVSGFLLLFALFERRVRWRVVAVLGSSLALVVVVVYLPFVLVFLRDLLPLVVRGGGSPNPGAGSIGLWGALGRIPLFFGWAYPALSIAGLFLILRRAPRPAGHALLAYGGTFALLVGLRAFGGDAFKDLKEIEFAGPFAALTTAASLDAATRSGRARCLAAVVTAAGLVAFGLLKYHAYFKATSHLIGLD